MSTKSQVGEAPVRDPDIEWAREAYRKIWPEDSFNHPNATVGKKLLAVLLEARAAEAEKIITDQGDYHYWPGRRLKRRAAELRRKAKELSV